MDGLALGASQCLARLHGPAGIPQKAPDCAGEGITRPFGAVPGAGLEADQLSGRSSTMPRYSIAVAKG
jgi:hypothetical protein